LVRAKQDLIPGMRVPIWFKAMQTSAQLRDRLSRTYTLNDDFKRVMFNVLATEDVKGRDGAVLVARGGGFNDDVVARLKEAGVTQFRGAPRNPVEVACAQLCGNSHFKMKGYVVVETQEEFDTWIAEQVAAKQGGGEWE
jgi:cytochrome c oxidase subunit 2